jgi:thiamine phosphate synthase YjbQ (UPF0047 family)
MNVQELKLDTSASKIVDLTPAIRDFCRGVGDGLLSVFAPHATVGLAIMEVGSGSEEDLEGALARLFPRDDSVYRHHHGSPGAWSGPPAARIVVALARDSGLGWRTRTRRLAKHRFG